MQRIWRRRLAMAVLGLTLWFTACTTDATVTMVGGASPPPTSAAGTPVPVATPTPDWSAFQVAVGDVDAGVTTD